MSFRPTSDRARGLKTTFALMPQSLCGFHPAQRACSGSARLWARLMLAFCAALVASAPVQAASPSPHRIVAVGDLHGDFAAWRAIARAAGLMDAQGHWAGGDTVFVQAGDVVDRGDDSLGIIHDLKRLEREAPRAHGRLVALIGNHEAMNMTHDLRYVSPADFAAFADAKSVERREQVYLANRATIEAAYRKRDPAMADEAIRKAWLDATPLGQIEHDQAWGPDGAIGRWEIGHPAVALIDGSLFVHGGISAAYACLSLVEINRRVAAALRARDTDPNAIINDPAGPLWYRGLVRRDDGDPTDSPAAGAPCATSAPSTPKLSMLAELEQVLHAYGAQRMIIGHTPDLSGIAILDGGRLARIDTGISSVFGGRLTYLEIVDNVPLPRLVERPAYGR